MTMTMASPIDRDAVLKNIQDWHQGRAAAATEKVERQRKRQAAKVRQDFNRGFNSLEGLLPR